MNPYMKKSCLFFVTVLIFQTIHADEGLLSFEIYKKSLVHNVIYHDNATPKAGDIVYVQPVDQIADPLFTQPEEISKGNDLVKYKNKRIIKNPYRRTHIVRTWIDYRNQLMEFAKSLGVAIYSEAEREFVAKQLYIQKGVRPLRNNQVSVALRNGLESTYNVEDLGLTKNISTSLFKLNEKVYHTAYNNGQSFEQPGLVIAIKPRGAILIQKGMHIGSIDNHEIFSTERGYRNQRFQLGEDVIYIFKGPASNITTEESGKVVAISPNGSLLIYIKKMGQLVKIDRKYASLESERKGLNLIQKLPMVCLGLFGFI